MSLRDAVTVVLMILGALLLLIAAIGIVRMPDLFLRMSATSKASSLGAGLLLLAVAASANDAGVTVRAIAGVVFLVLTTPVASHMIGRAAYLLGVPLFEGTVCDDLAGKYDRQRRRLRSGAPETPSDDAPDGGIDPGSATSSAPRP